MDGGLVDNLSLRNLVNAVTLWGGWDAIFGRIQRRGINKLAIIVVNAAVETKQDWAQRERIPGIISVVSALSNSSVLRTNKETEALVESSLALWQSQHPARKAGTNDQPKVYIIHVDFHSASDAAERAYFDAIPTSLQLPPETVDRLIQAAGRLLREAPAFKELLRDLESNQLVPVLGATPWDPVGLRPPGSYASSASSNALNFRSVSANSRSGSDPATIPPPAYRRARAASITAERMPTRNSPPPRWSIQPTGPA